MLGLGVYGLSCSGTYFVTTAHQAMKTQVDN
jgi:hypothetical protein